MLTILVLVVLGIVIGGLLLNDRSLEGSRRAVLTGLLVALRALLVLRILFFLFVGWRFRRRVVVGPGVVDMASSGRA